MLLPLTTIQADHGLSAYLFLGSNNTLHEDRRVSEIDLSGIPATHNSSGYRLQTSDTSGAASASYAPPLASVLVCDPRMNISSVTVVRETNRSLYVISANSARPRVGNIPEDTASAIFSLALLSATTPSPPFINPNFLINFLAASLFMTDPTVSSDTAPDGSSPLTTHPLPLPVINANLDAFVLSASKAYSYGYMREYGTDAGLETIAVNGTVQVQRLALVASVSHIIITMVWVSVATFLLATLVLGRDGGQPFTLESIIKVMQHKPHEFQVIVEQQQALEKSQGPY